MILRGTPKHIDDFIKVDGSQAYELQEHGFYPLYVDENYVYFKKDKELTEFLREENH